MLQKALEIQTQDEGKKMILGWIRERLCWFSSWKEWGSTVL